MGNVGKKERKESDPSKPAISRVTSVPDTPLELVLYGAGETGKTTFANALRHSCGIINENEEEEIWKPRILYNVLEGAIIILNNGFSVLSLQLTDPVDIRCAALLQQEFLESTPNRYSFRNKENVVQAIRHLNKNCEQFDFAKKQGNKFSLFATWEHFADQLERFPAWGGDRWKPEWRDWVRVRNRTTGARPFTFDKSIGGITRSYKLTDLGGQKEERNKRIVFSILGSMDCVLYFTSLTEYQERLFEDHKKLRIYESLKCWEELLNDESADSKPIIFFFNKFDLFKKKYYEQRIPIAVRGKNFEELPSPAVEFEVSDDCQHAMRWFESVFRMKIPRKRRARVSFHVMSSLDLEQVQKKANLGVEFLNRVIEEIDATGRLVD